MEIALRSPNAMEQVVPCIMVGGKMVQLRLHNETIVIAEIPEGVIGGQVAAMLSMMMGTTFTEMAGLPGQYKVEPCDVTPEIDRLLEEQDKELEFLRKIPEPTVEINVSDPFLDAMVPVGKKIWDSIFVKPMPVVNVNNWLQGIESDDYVYVPNDSSKRPEEQEESLSNAMYTEIMVNAYRLLCERKNINPKIRLQNGIVMQAKSIRPVHGTQHTILGEKSSRLANSKLEDFNDSAFAKDYIECICDLEESQFEKESIRRRVLSKVEYILMGRTSHTYNQRFIHLLYDKFVNQVGEDDPWVNHRVPLTHCILGTLKQMVVEGLVLEDNMELFLLRLKGAGFGDFQEGVSRVFNQCKGGRYVSSQ